MPTIAPDPRSAADDSRKAPGHRPGGFLASSLPCPPGFFVRMVCTLCLAGLLCSASPLCAADDPLFAARTATIDFLLDRAVSRNLISGGVVVVGNRDGILLSTARGRVSAAPDAQPFSVRTIFDVASLTKVLATTSAVMQLLDEGLITLMDPLTRWFPEFEGSGREDITILNLLTHTSGLNDVNLNTNEPLKTAIQRAADQKNWRLPGNRFLYADINFILLGELVHRITGHTLDTFCRERIFAPLDMRETMFLPPRELSGVIAPTMGSNNELSCGTVQDENSRRLGGIAGHAGLFSSAEDLARFAQLLLQGGILDGKRIFSERVIGQMTAPYFYNSGSVVRGLGWDMDSPFSAPKGTFFSDGSFGHTGYSGSSIWIDPQRNLFVILLTTRLDYQDTKQFNRLRSDISTLAVAAFWESVTEKSKIEQLQAR